MPYAVRSRPLKEGAGTGSKFISGKAEDEEQIRETEEEEEEEEADRGATSGVKEAMLSCCNLWLYSVAIVAHRGCYLMGEQIQ
jgi:hypothetical protein